MSALPTQDPLGVAMLTSPDGGIGQYTWCLSRALCAEQQVSARVLMVNTPEYDSAPLAHADGQVALPILDAPGPSRIQKMFGVFINAGRFFEQSRKRDPRSGKGAEIAHIQWTVSPAGDRMIWNALQWGRTRRMPIVYTAHDVLPHERRAADIAHNLWRYERADALIVHGQQLRSTLLEIAPGIPPEKVHVIPHGSFIPIADDPLLAGWTREKARASFSVDDDERVILFFGYVRPYKGLDVLIEALRILSLEKGLPRFRLLIAGRTLTNFHGPDGEGEQIRRAGLEDRTTLSVEYIALKDLGRFFRAADIVALPYRSGSQSGIIQMAYAFSRPALVTNVGSLGEVVEPDKTAMIVPPADAGAFAAGLRTLLLDQQKATALGQAGRRYAETVLNWSDIATTTRALYNSLLGAR